jgi:PilZ domain
MSPRKQIKAKELAKDIRSRMSDFEVMAKYELSLNELQRVLEELVEAEVMRPGELHERGSFYDDPANRRLTRGTPRIFVGSPIPIIDTNNPSAKCFLRNVSTHGIRVAGIEVSAGDIKTFSIPGEALPGVSTFQFEAKCRWVEERGTDQRYFVAGFQITAISEQAEKRLFDLIRIVTYGA